MTESLKQRGHQRRIGSAQAAAQSKPGLQWSSESGITEIVLPWKALSRSGILPGYVLRTEPSSFLLNLSSRRITQFFLSLDRRIGRLNAQNPLLLELKIPTSSRSASRAHALSAQPRVHSPSSRRGVCTSAHLVHIYPSTTAAGRVGDSIGPIFCRKPPSAGRWFGRRGCGGSLSLLVRACRRCRRESCRRRTCPDRTR